VAPSPPGTSRAENAAPRFGARGRSRKARARAQTENAGAMVGPEMPDSITLVRELNHRVKNNLQIIVSLMNLQKRMMPPERREDIRFIEEHVQSMSVAYRLVYATGSMIEVSLIDLATEVLSGLRQIAGLGEEFLRLDTDTADALIGLDLAVALALYMAVLLPPYLDHGVATGGVVTITLTVAANLLTLSVRGAANTAVRFDSLRGRLMQAYAGQLKAEVLPAAAHRDEQIRFRLEKPVGTPATI
jgi:two-component sensor histidine kinase